MEVWEAIQNKHAVRQFKDQPLPDEVVERILRAGRRAQSAKNSQPWDFIAVRERETLEKLATMGTGMGWVAGAALSVAIVTPLPGERWAWHMFDAGQSASYMQLAAVEMGVGSCLGTVYKPDECRALLGFPEDKLVTITVSFGYPDDEEERKPGRARGRRPLDELVHWERW